MDEKLQNIIHLIQVSPLDQTVKDILVRDLEAEGLNDFLREQIKAYCLEGLKQIDEKIAAAKKELEQVETEQPSA